MPDIQHAAQEVNDALDRITQAGSDQNAVRQAVNDAKQKVQALVQQAQQGGQGAQGTGQSGTHQAQGQHDTRQR